MSLRCPFPSRCFVFLPTPVTLPRGTPGYVCVPSGAADRAKSSNPRTRPVIRYPPLFSRGCSACECAAVSGAASRPAWPEAREGRSVSTSQLSRSSALHLRFVFIDHSSALTPHVGYHLLTLTGLKYDSRRGISHGLCFATLFHCFFTFQRSEYTTESRRELEIAGTEMRQIAFEITSLRRHSSVRQWKGL